MKYEDIVRGAEDNKYLIGMVPIEAIVRLGAQLDLNRNTRVLDLCCGYGTVLKVWSELFGISGKGVDIWKEFIDTGKERLKEADVDRIELIEGDVLKYIDNEKYDIVIMSETFESIENTIDIGESFLKPDGFLLYQKLYSKVKDTPRELRDFDGEVLPLSELEVKFKSKNYYIAAMASDSVGKWEHYVLNWCGRRNMRACKDNPNDEEAREWADKWTKIYFDFRREYEGQAIFALEKMI